MKNTQPDIQIKQGDIQTVLQVSGQIPEFIDPHGVEEYQKRLSDVPALILIAWVNSIPAAFKVGYERDDYFYSWMGGVLPQYRKMQLATRLAEAQETWAKEQGYPHVTFKTRNRLKPMLIFALQRGFNIIGFEKKEQVGEHRIILRKKLL